MRNKKLIRFLFFLLLAAVVAVCFIPANEPQIVGSLPAGDIAEIKRVVSHEIWRGTMPNHSWQTLRNLPGNIQSRISNRILRIEAMPGSVVRTTVGTGKSKPTEDLRAAYYDIFLRKDMKGWQVLHPVGDFDPGARINPF